MAGGSAAGASAGPPSASPSASAGPSSSTGPSSSVGPSASAGPSSSAGPSPSAGPSASAGVRSPAPDEFLNPVYDAALADPFVLEDDGTYYAYGTKAFEANQFETARSTDLGHWERLPSALRGLPSWSPGKAWAPEVAKTSAGYVMYYTASAPDVPNPHGDPSQCITLAVGDSPAGPLVDRSEKPLVCQPELGGSIDATYFKDVDDTPYLIWKNDGNCCDIPTRFYLQELSPDGLELVGKVSELGIRNDRPWEGRVIEAPTLLERDGTYYLFYSGGDFASAGYAVGYATADRLRGPYEDSPDNPILVSKAPAAGPGHQSIVADKDGDLWMVYHAWDAKRIGEQNGGQRKMWIDELVFEDGKPLVKGPDQGPQALP
ncbi:MAG: family 43 glycosylhydrolase [Chloroflexi bacterium]|nr:family 43 glycosylhydrolase [Chloroflexota bacterium]